MLNIILHSIAPFLFGLIFGFFLGNAYAKAKGDKNRIFEGTVSITIFFLWAYSLYRDIQGVTSNTPFFLHIFMGAVLGAINKEFGDFLLKIIKK